MYRKRDRSKYIQGARFEEAERLQPKSIWKASLWFLNWMSKHMLVLLVGFSTLGIHTSFSFLVYPELKPLCTSLALADEALSIVIPRSTLHLYPTWKLGNYYLPFLWILYFNVLSIDYHKPKRYNLPCSFHIQSVNISSFPRGTLHFLFHLFCNLTC